MEGWEWVGGGVEESSGGGERGIGGGEVDWEGGGGRCCLLGCVGWGEVMH